MGAKLSRPSFIKCSSLALVVQLVGCAVIWISTLVWSPALDSLFEKMIFFYWPTIMVVAKLLGAEGESAMIAAPIYGMGLGMLLYAAVVGFLINRLRVKAR